MMKNWQSGIPGTLNLGGRPSSETKDWKSYWERLRGLSGATTWLRQQSSSIRKHITGDSFTRIEKMLRQNRKEDFLSC
ncbi:hypothetical protein Y1Q_0002491 [Alligator mississippiensis]|uniref:Uncharacterized protein n=1 Tax=Alligator mississippiensis TaxID=8496 RepID=A0A151NBP2_ALLMI|nr:hypothetical protein Y1Q_0002491 [Alligator mississippiensis]